MATFSLDHLHLRSPDPEATARYYVDLFEGEITDRSAAGGRRRVTVAVAGLVLLVDEVPEGTPALPEPPHLGLEHVGFRVEDLHRTIADLRGRGAHVVMEPQSPRPGLHIAFLRGPEGVRIELLQRDPA